MQVGFQTLYKDPECQITDAGLRAEEGPPKGLGLGCSFNAQLD